MLEIVGENVVASDVVLGSWSWSRGTLRTLCGLGLGLASVWSCNKDFL